MRNKSMRICATLTACAVIGGVVCAAAPQIDSAASVLIGQATPGQATAGKTRVDATTGASVLLTPDSDYAPDSYPVRGGRHVPDNLGNDAPATARVVIRGERTNFGLNTNTGRNGTAFGANAVAKKDYAAAIGNGANVNAVEGLAMGHNASVTGNGSIAIGGGSTAAETNVVSVGNDTTQRRIVNVADGRIAAGSHDVVTGNQLYQYGANMTGGLSKEIKNVGAASAALAGLHPLDYTGSESKFQIAAALGSYDGKKAVAMGGFYNASRDLMLSFGAASNFGDSHKLSANIGATFRVGKEGEPSVRQDSDLAERMDAMEREMRQLREENKELQAKVAQLQK